MDYERFASDLPVDQTIVFSSTEENEETMRRLSVTSLASRLQQIRDELQTAADIDLGDYLEFLIAAVRTELLGAPEGGARFPVRARMAGRVLGSFHIDVGIGDALYGMPERLQGDDLLAFAGIAPAEVLAVPEAHQFAEKVHAYTFPWTDRSNTRSRDLVGIVPNGSIDDPQTAGDSDRPRGPCSHPAVLR